jgi:hypothetical protein
MIRKLAQVALALGLLSLPLVLWADSSLNYQDRGDRHEGLRPKPVSGYDIEVISVLADYQEPATQLPDQLRVGFYLRDKTPHLTVREQDYRLYYWLDKVKPAKEWRAMSMNEYTWPTAVVLRQLDQKLNPYELGVLIRLGREGPAQNEEIAPAILYHGQPPDRIAGYLFTMKTNGDARLSCKVLGGKGSAELMTRAFRRLPGGRPFTVEWNAAGAQEGEYELACHGYFLDTNQRLEQTIRFFHKPTAR